MAPEYSGQGDPMRSLSLLWGLPRKPRRGPKPGLAIDAIVAAAISVADAQGLGSLTMQRVAKRLGVATMSLYTYFATKSEMLDLMLDTVHGELAQALPMVGAGLTGEKRRTELEAYARADWDLHLRHPWMLQISSSRAVLGPNETIVLEKGLQIVDGVNLSGRDMMAAVGLLRTYVRGAVSAAIDAIQAPAATGQSDMEWWLERAPLLEALGVYSAERFPTVVRVQAEGGFDVTRDEDRYTETFAIEDFEFGLRRVLDGLEAYISATIGAQMPDQAESS